MASQSEVVSLLKPLGIRLTPQRLAIAEVVINSADHPTVREIFDRVQAFFPYVTIATVYSTLATLEQCGIVRELPFQRHSRYDANLAPHANLVCIVLRLDHRRRCRAGHRGRAGAVGLHRGRFSGRLPAGGLLWLVFPGVTRNVVCNPG